MERLYFILSLAAAFMFAAIPVMAQEDNGFKKFNVVEDFTDNGFQWFRDAQLLCAGAPRHVLAQTA